MRRRIRALALATVGGLLLLAPVTASATSPSQFNAILQPYEADLTVNSWSVRYREAKASQMTDIDALLDARWFSPAPGAAEAPVTRAIDNGSRYDGKQLPI